MTVHIQDIALSKLVSSSANVRRTGRAERVEELAASIAAHGLLQNLTVRPVEKQRFEVIAGGRRLAALKLLAKRKQWVKNAPVPCQIIDGENATEISLAENAMQCPMHPADQFEAFAALHGQQMSVEDIAARFGVAPKIVTQRLKLGAVSAKLMAVYREGEMNLDQLSAFAITDDHSLQERVWDELGYDRSRAAILKALNEGQVSSDDRRAIYVGAEAYLAAGGTILRDLFDEGDGGFFNDTALLNRMACDKLAMEAEKVSAEGWQWVDVETAFDYALAAGMRRIYPVPRALTEAEDQKIAELSARYDALCIEADGDDSDDELEKTLSAIEDEIDVLRGDDAYAPEEIAMAGAFVSLGRDGKPRIERGFIRREDDVRHQAEKAGPDGDAASSSKDELPANLIAELTAYRTMALANELAQRPDQALIAVIHALAAPIFYPYAESASCLRIDAHRAYLDRHAKDIAETRGGKEIAARHAEWEHRVPEDSCDLWAFILALADTERQSLLAHCASLTLDAVRLPKAVGTLGLQRHADTIAAALALDMTAYWQPTAAGLFGRIAKPRILRAVREGVSPEAAQAIENLKKPAMAARAEQLLAGKGWLPEVLRRPSP